MRVLCRGRITDVTSSGEVYAVTTVYGVVGPIDTIGMPVAGTPALIAAVDDTGDLAAICGTDGLTALIQQTVASAADFEAFKAAIAAW